MSGFIGIIANQLQKADTVLLDISTAAIAACCDDYLGAWNSNHADLRFGWLKTCEDTAEEKLPFAIDEHIRIVGDVRLDNRLALVSTLSASFNAISDTTPDSYLILYAYKHWGEDLLQHISGDYAFAIWNEQTNYLFCARDHFGLIPFYYTQFDNRLLFTNFYLALKDVPNLTSELDDDVLRDYMRGGVNWCFDQTIYKNLKRLPPAHKLVYKEGKVEISCYWEIPAAIKPIRYKTTKEYVHHFYRLFEQSIIDRTRTNKVASSLSGGMDSSAITAVVKKILEDKYGKDQTLVAYNISYNQLIRENEGHFGRLTANKLNIPVKQYIAEEYIKNIALPLTSWIPEPVAIPAATAESQILSDAATFSRVYLTGFGGDPLFEYEPYSRQQLKAQGYLLIPFLDDFRFFKAFGSITKTIARKTRELVKKIPESSIPIPPWFDSKFFQSGYSIPKKNKNGSSLRSNFGMSGNPFWYSLFETTHPGFTGKKIKVRQPFFSLDLLLFVLALPPHLLYKKSLLRMAFAPYLPREIVERPKTLLFGDPHSQNFKKQDVLDMLHKNVSASGDFLTGKIDIQVLLNEVTDPRQLSTSFRHMLNILQILAWRNCRS